MTPVSKKITLSGLVLFCLIGSFLASCSKNVSQDRSGASSAALTLSDASVKRGQPLVATLPAGVSPSTITWSASPSSLVHVTAGNGQAMFLFAGAGNYQVKAIYPSADGKSTDSSGSPVTVVDEPFYPQFYVGDTVSLAGDQVTLTPMSDPTKGLVLLAQSTKKYDCYPGFVGYTFSGIDPVAGVTLNFWKVAEGNYLFQNNCNGGTNPAQSYLFFPQSQPYPNGSYPFSVILNNTTYQGTLTITDQSFSFLWSYDSGVMISPKQISR